MNQRVLSTDGKHETLAIGNVDKFLKKVGLKKVGAVRS